MNENLNGKSFGKWNAWIIKFGILKLNEKKNMPSNAVLKIFSLIGIFLHIK